MKEAEYNDSPYTQELYCEPVRSTNNGYYQQTIYEDERIGYAPFPVYTPVLGENHFHNFAEYLLHYVYNYNCKCNYII